MIYLFSKLYKQLDKSSEVFLYYGKITDKLTEAITAIEGMSPAKKGALAAEKKILFLLVESIQNIIRHNERRAQEQQGLVCVSKKDDGIFLTTGNSIHKDKIDLLRERIDHINTLSESELKKEYKKVLSEGEFSDQGGAGLGLIQMARKTLQKIDYAFEKNTDTHYFFLMEIKIISQKEKAALFEKEE